MSQTVSVKEHLELGDHTCSIYRNKDELYSSVIPFFTYGLDKGEKCIYIFDEQTPEEIHSAFQTANLYPQNRTFFGKLDTFSQNETYLKGGFFDPDMMTLLLRQTILSSLHEGYTGTRIAGEMTWLLLNDIPIEVLISYESKLNTVVPVSKVTGICQYNETKFSPEFLIDIIRTHPYIFIYGKLYENKYFYTPPEYSTQTLKHFGHEYYKTILSIIQEDDRQRAESILN